MPLAATRFGLDCEKIQCTEFDKDKAGYWDDCVKGSSSLRAALARALDIDLATANGMSVVAILWDLSKFFDRINLSHLIRASLKLGFSPVAALMALKAHRATRALTVRTGAGECLSDYIVPNSQSILAGCIFSVTFARMFLYDLLEHMHVAHPGTRLNSWVDDMFQSTRAGQGQEDYCVSLAIDAAKDFHNRVGKLGGLISKKTVALASTTSLYAKLKTALLKAKLPIKLSSVGKDLGCDISIGAQRGARSARKHFAASFARARKVKKLMLKHRGHAASLNNRA